MNEDKSKRQSSEKEIAAMREVAETANSYSDMMRFKRLVIKKESANKDLGENENPSPSTPLEIFEHKVKACSLEVRVGEDFDLPGKGWCEKNLSKHSWRFVKYTDVFEHSFFFENEIDARRFEAFIAS